MRTDQVLDPLPGVFPTTNAKEAAAEHAYCSDTWVPGGKDLETHL